MTTIFTKGYNAIANLPYAIMGTNKQLLAKYDYKSKAKVVNLGRTVMLPMLVWFFSGYLIGKNILEVGTFYALLIALTCATIIFFVESLIVNADSKSKGLAIFRVGLAFIIATIGSGAIDLNIFENDINHSITTEAIANLQKKNTEALLQIETAKQRADMEAKGAVGSSGVAGGGKIWEQKVADAYKINIQNTAIINKHTQEIENLKNGGIINATTKNALGYNTILYRLKKLHEIVQTDSAAKGSYILFLLLGFALEVVALIFKYTYAPTAFDLDQEAKEKLLLSRRMQVLENDNFQQKITYGGLIAPELLKNISPF